MLLAWLGRKHNESKASDAAARIAAAVSRVMTEAKSLTPDLGGKASTQAMGDAVAEAVAKG
jgi:3-isopropylmalate dehydrogenase